MFSINHWYDRFFKIISIISFFLILFLLIIIFQVGPAASYEFSIYDAYPWYFWVFLFSAVICAYVVIIVPVIVQSKKNYWLFGLCSILISNAILLFMPVIRGYYFSDYGDILTHIGYMKDILHTSSIGQNFYPINHILGVIIHLFSGLSLLTITLIIPPIFSFFFILSIYCVGKTIFQNKFELMTLIILSSILMFDTNQLAFAPNCQVFFLVPLMLFLAFKMYCSENYKKFNILLLIIGLLIVFYHPLVTVIVILILSLMQIMQYIPEKYNKRILKKVNYTYTIFFMLAVFTSWSAYLTMLSDVAKPIIARIFGEEIIESELQNNISVLSQVMVDPIYIVKLLFNIYGQLILLGILSLLSIGLILKSMRNQDTKSKYIKGILIIEYIVITGLSIAILLSINSFGFGRIYILATLFSLLLIPTGFYLFLYNNPKDKSISGKKIVKLLGIIFIFFCITYFSIFNLYQSPIIKKVNEQVPKSDYIGESTFFTFRDESLPILELGIATYRFEHAILGYSNATLEVFYNDNKRFVPPFHFGYQNQTLSRDFYLGSKYLLINERGRGWSPHVFPEFEYMWSFNPKDFGQLKIDKKIQQIYSNGNLEIFKL